MSLISNAFGNTNTGVVGKINNSLGLGSSQPSTLGVQAKAPVVAPQKNTLPPNQIKTTLTPQIQSSTQNGTTGNKFDANVLATQKALNLKGAGLKEDGILGPLTSAAIAKYSNQSAPQSTPQVTQPTQQTGYTPNAGLFGQLITGLANQSQSQPINNISQQLESGDYQQRINDAIAAQNRAVGINQALNQAINDQTKSAIPITFQQGRQAAIQRDYGVQADAAVRAAQNAQNIASTTQAGLTSAGGLRNTQQGLIQQALQQAAGLAVPQNYSPTSIPYNPVTGQFGGLAGNAAGGLGNIGAFQQQQQQGADTQTMLSAYNQTSGLIKNFKNQIQSDPTFNQSPLILGNQLSQWLKTGVISDPKYTNIINTLSEIANTIAPVLGSPGNPTDLKTTIANQLVPRLMQGQSLATVLDNLETNALTKINASKSTATGTPLNVPQQKSGNSIWSF